MELQIQDLVSSIRKDGIESANKESAAIISEAKKQAAAILAEAESEAKKTRENAQQEIEVYRNSARLDAQQAKRDAVLAFRKEIEAEMEKILTVDVHKAMDAQTMAKLIQALVQGEDLSAYAVEVGQVSEELKSQLAEQLKGGLEIRPSKKVQAGFRLAAKDGSSYLDCSDEELSEMLMPFFRDIHL